MSNNYYETDKLILTAFVNDDTKNALQLTFQNDKGFIVLSKEEQIELAINILLRTGTYVSACGDEAGVKK